MGPVGPLFLINEPRVLIVLYFSLDGYVVVYLICCILGRAPRTKETLSDFCSIMGPGKWDTTVWYRLPDKHKFSAG